MVVAEIYRRKIKGETQKRNQKREEEKNVKRLRSAELEDNAVRHLLSTPESVPKAYGFLSRRPPKYNLRSDTLISTQLQIHSDTHSLLFCFCLTNIAILTRFAQETPRVQSQNPNPRSAIGFCVVVVACVFESHRTSMFYPCKRNQEQRTLSRALRLPSGSRSKSKTFPTTFSYTNSVKFETSSCAL